MGAISKWLLHEDQTHLFDLLFAAVVNLVFLGVVSCFLWAADNFSYAIRIGRAFCLLWGVTILAHFFLVRIHEFFKVNIYDHGNAFLISNLFVSCALQVGWAVFAAWSLQRVTFSASMAMTATWYVIGFISCLVTFYAVSAFFPGHFYKFVSLPLALIVFIVTSVWVHFS